MGHPVGIGMDAVRQGAFRVMQDAFQKIGNEFQIIVRREFCIQSGKFFAVPRGKGHGGLDAGQDHPGPGLQAGTDQQIQIRFGPLRQ